MNQSNRVCKMKGHSEQLISHICTLLECTQPTRWCCSQCILQGIHNHEKTASSHVIKTQELILMLQNESEKFEVNQEGVKIMELIKTLEKIVQTCQGLENSINDYRKSIEGQIQYITQSQAILKSNYNNLVIDKFEQLDNKMTNELLKINLQQVYQNRSIYSLDNIQKQLNSMESIIKDYQENKQDNARSIINLKNRKYIAEQIVQEKDYVNYYGTSISKNEQYLAYGGDDKLLKIYEIKQRKIIKEIEIDDCITVCQFTQDSSVLYVGQQSGYVCGYNVLNNFKEICKQQIHSSGVYNLIAIQNQNIITCSNNESIIKTDTKSKQQIFKLTGHTNLIRAIDYNDKYEIVASGSDDN